MKIDQEHVQYFAEKYRKGQKKLTIIIFTLVMIIGSAIVISDAILCIFAYKQDLLWLYCVMLIVGAIDIYFGIKFFKFSINKTKYMKKREAAERYIRIHGFQPDEINNIPIEKKEKETE